MLYSNRWAMPSPSVCLAWLLPPQVSQLEVSVNISEIINELNW